MDHMLKTSNSLKRCKGLLNKRSQQKEHLMTASTSKVSLIVIKAENNSDYKGLVEIVFLYDMALSFVHSFFRRV